MTDTKVWVETSFTGNAYVMIQNEHEGSKPFCYCTFHYNYDYTCNASIRKRAEEMARLLGAVGRIDHRHREINL